MYLCVRVGECVRVCVLVTARKCNKVGLYGAMELNKRIQERWTSLQSDQNLRGPHVAWRAAAIDRYLLPAPDLSSKPADRRCCCRSTGQTDGRTDTGPFYDAYWMLHANRV